jgi:hypothetical protein
MNLTAEEMTETFEREAASASQRAPGDGEVGDEPELVEAGVSEKIGDAVNGNGSGSGKKGGFREGGKGR